MNNCKYCGKEIKNNENKNCCNKNECVEKYRLDYAKSLGYKINLENLPNRYSNFGTYEINLTFKQFSDFIRRDLGGWIIDLKPPYQRDLVWTEEQKIGWIEHILRGGKTSNILYFNCPNWYNVQGKTNWHKTFECVDGSQRVSAILDFVDGKFKIFGEYYHDDIFMPIMNNLRVNVNNLTSKKEVAKLYIEMNSCGTPHTREDLDKAIKILEEDN